MKRKWKKLLAGVCAAAMGLTMFSTAGIPAQSVQAEEAPSGREVLKQMVCSRRQLPAVGGGRSRRGLGAERIPASVGKRCGGISV